MFIYPIDDSYNSYAYTAWNSAGILESNCDSFSYLKFPFDTQRCNVILEMTATENDTVKMKCEKCQIDSMSTTSFLGESDIWEFAYPATPCTCKEEVRLGRNEMTISRLNFEFNFRRKPIGFMASVFYPIYILWVLQLVALSMPPTNGDRPALSMTIVLSFVVVLSLILGMIPQSSELSYIEMVVISKFGASALLTIYMIVLVSLAERPALVAKRKSGMSPLKTLDLIVFIVTICLTVAFDVWAFLQMTS